MEEERRREVVAEEEEEEDELGVGLVGRSSRYAKVAGHGERNGWREGVTAVGSELPEEGDGKERDADADGKERDGEEVIGGPEIINQGEKNGWNEKLEIELENSEAVEKRREGGDHQMSVYFDEEQDADADGKERDGEEVIGGPEIINQGEKNGWNEKLEIVPENSEAVEKRREDGDHQRSVYFDEEQGIWKCRECSWNYKVSNDCMSPFQFGSYCTDMIDVKTSPPHGYSYVSHFKGQKSTSEPTISMSHIDMTISESEIKIHETTNSASAKSHQHFLENSLGKQSFSLFSGVHHANGTTETKSDVDSQQVPAPIRENNSRLTEMDVERMLEEQDTHDLYCPNCNSCITKRIILRKRKRIISKVHIEAKRERIETIQIDTVAGSESSDTTTNEGNARESVFFRCLECFCFFIPTGGGIFKIFGKRGDSENIQTSQPEDSKVNCFSFLFETMNGKNKEHGQESQQLIGGAASTSGTSEQTTNDVRWKIQESGLSEDEESLLITEESGRMPSKNTGDAMGESVTPARDINTEDNVPTEFAGKSPLFFNPPVSDGDTANNLPGKQESLTTPVISTTGPPKMPAIESSEILTIVVSKFNDCSKEISEVKNLAPVQPVGESIVDNLNPLVAKNQESMNQHCLPTMGPPKIPAIEPPKMPAFVIKEFLDGFKPSGEATVKDGTRPAHLVSPLQTDSGCSVPERSSGLQHIVPINDDRISAPGRMHDWDVLKAVVYGGLIESITSLCIVSSSAAAQATTLNIVILAFANLVGGLFLIVNNLLELHGEQYQALHREGEQVDRYWELLGRRGHFRLHATVAVLSFLLVGVLPPALYGFTFRKSDNREYKLIVVAAASLVCITLLALAKAHVQRAPKPYIKILLKYVGLGVTASGLSYVSGVLLKRLLDKLGVFDHSSGGAAPSTVGFFGLNSAFPEWVSY